METMSVVGGGIKKKFNLQVVEEKQSLKRGKIDLYDTPDGKTWYTQEGGNKACLELTGKQI